MLEIRGIWLCHMSRWDRYVLRPRVRAETSGSETVPHIGPYKVERQIRIPAPLVFDFSRRNEYRFSDTQFDEITGRYQFHNPTEGVVPDEEERVVYPPVREETVTPWGEGSSSGWGAGPSSSWEDPRTSVYAPEGAYDPWTYQHYHGEGGS